MKKRYDSSGIQKKFSFGIKWNGAEIEDDTLFIYQKIFPMALDINYIERIESGVLTNREGASYGFEITMASKRKVTFIYSLMEGATLKELFADLLAINPSISLDETAEKILNDDIQKKRRLKFDFVSHKGQRLKMDAQFSMKYPSLDFALVCVVLLAYFLIPFGLGFLGNWYFTQTIGEGYPIYRNVMIIVGSLALCTALMNVIMALVSQYLGHKVTIISLLLFFVFLAIGLL